MYATYLPFFHDDDRAKLRQLKGLLGANIPEGHLSNAYCDCIGSFLATNNIMNRDMWVEDVLQNENNVDLQVVFHLLKLIKDWLDTSRHDHVGHHHKTFVYKTNPKHERNIQNSLDYTLRILDEVKKRLKK